MQLVRTQYNELEKTKKNISYIFVFKEKSCNKNECNNRSLPFLIIINNDDSFSELN